MGAPEDEPAHYGNPHLHYRKIERSLAVATKEVTLEQFQAFEQDHRHEPRYGDAPELAAIHVSWFGAARYCNWLSAQAGIDKSQWCYPEPYRVWHGHPRRGRQSRRVSPSDRGRVGVLCRAGTETSRPYGESTDLLSRYAWTWLNSDNQVHPPGLLLPNEFGLFDVLGNAWEWCHDGPVGDYVPQETPLPPYPQGTKRDPSPDLVPTETVNAQDRAHETWRILRGGRTATLRIEPDLRSGIGNHRAIIVNTSASASSGHCHRASDDVKKSGGRRNNCANRPKRRLTCPIGP